MTVTSTLVSCPANTLSFDEGILDAQMPRNAKGDAKPSSSHFAVAVRQKTLAPKGLASFGAEPLRRSAHTPSRVCTRCGGTPLHPKWANQNSTYWVSPSL